MNPSSLYWSRRMVDNGFDRTTPAEVSSVSVSFFFSFDNNSFSARVSSDTFFVCCAKESSKDLFIFSSFSAIHFSLFSRHFLPFIACMLYCNSSFSWRYKQTSLWLFITCFLVCFFLFYYYYFFFLVVCLFLLHSFSLFYGFSVLSISDIFFFIWKLEKNSFIFSPLAIVITQNITKQKQRQMLYVKRWWCLLGI